MKALIAAEKDTLITQYKDVLKKNGYETIAYNWILKALDNLGEIDPDIIILNISDYPRQWKVFVQYIHTVFGDRLPKIYITSTEEISEKSREEASFLGCKEFSEDAIAIKTIEPEPEEDIFIEDPVVLQPKPIIVKQEKPELELDIPNEPSEEPEIQVEPEVPLPQELLNTITFHHPKTGELLSGTVKNFNDPMFLFVPDLQSTLRLLRFGMRINNAVFSLDNKTVDINIQVQGLNDQSIEMCILGKSTDKTRK